MAGVPSESQPSSSRRRRIPTWVKVDVAVLVLGPVAESIAGRSGTAGFVIAFFLVVIFTVPYLIGRRIGRGRPHADATQESGADTLSSPDATSGAHGRDRPRWRLRMGIILGLLVVAATIAALALHSNSTTRDKAYAAFRHELDNEAISYSETPCVEPHRDKAGGTWFLCSAQDSSGNYVACSPVYVSNRGHVQPIRQLYSDDNECIFAFSLVTLGTTNVG